MKDIFQENIEQYDSLQLADWINRCRIYIRKEDFSSSNTPQEDYLNAVVQFCSDWKNHYQKYKELYESDKFRKAILLNGINKDRIVIVQNEREIDITENIFRNLMSDTPTPAFKNILEEYKNKLMKSIEEYYEIFQNLNSVEGHRNYICELLLHSGQYETVAYSIKLKDEKLLLHSDLFDKLTSKDIEKTIEEHFMPTDYSFEKYSLGIGRKYNVLDIVKETLPKYNISPTQYYEYKKEDKKHIDKKLFINIGFYLSLDIDSLEALMNVNGYTVVRSKEIEDKIISECFTIGFGQEYTDIVLTSQGLLSLKIRDLKRNTTLSIIFEESDISDKRYLKALELAIKKVDKFIGYKLKKLETLNSKLPKLDQKLAHYKEALKVLEEKFYSLEEKVNKLESSKTPHNEECEALEKLENKLSLCKADIKEITEKKDAILKEISAITTAGFFSEEVFGLKHDAVYNDKLTLEELQNLKNELEAKQKEAI